jgi:Second Messenger Oligonucleotide or Dinucleotide Synthetase domain
MISLETKETQLDDLLDRMARDLQLDETRYKRMLSTYEAVKDWIEGDEIFFKPFKYDVYPHGSVRIRTTVKPFGSNEFDLDIAIHLAFNTRHTPQRIYSELKRRLEASDLYKPKMVLKNRCIRLEYAGDYHIDILPGIQENALDHNKIMVPDRELRDWVSSNPRGYAEWFLGRANLARQSLLEKALRSEKLPRDSYDDKKPLQVAVQLIKRYRDVYFHENDEYSTSSIILTTMAGQYYSGEESIFETVDQIVAKVQEKVQSSFGRIKIFNPVNPDEDFTDKWDAEPKYYDAFKGFVAHLATQWQELKRDNGVIAESATLRGLFGSDILMKAMTDQGKDLQFLRENQSLGINRGSGILSSIASAGAAIVKPNTFFGENEV